MNNKTVKIVLKTVTTLLIVLLFPTVTKISAYANELLSPWAITTSLPFDIASFPSTTYLDKIFTFGGATTFVRSEITSSSILPDGSLGSWDTLSSVPLPQNLFWHSLVQSENYVYILGGAIYPNNTVNSVNTVYRGSFDSSGNVTNWEEMTPLPKRLSFGSATVSQNKIYYSGGGTWTGGGSPEVSDQIYMAEIGSGGEITSWQTLSTSLPLPLFQHSLVNTGQKLILIGGTSSPWTPLATVFSVDILPDGKLGSWVQLSSLVHPIRASMINKIGNLIILAGGVNDSGISNDVYYSILDNSGNPGNWVASSNKLPSPNHSAGSAIWKDYLYIIGGNDGNKYINSAWVTKINYSGPTPTATPIPPTPTPTPPTPVVFLPGLGASFNFKEMFLNIPDPDNWRMTPGVRVYDNFLKAFEGNPNFHIFYYDWRKPIIESAQKLNDYIRNTVNPQNNKVNLVGHSLGGLVARTCVQKTAHNCYINKLITVGSPNAGSVDAYPALEGGEIWRTGPSKLSYELLLHYLQQPGETKRETIERVTPVLKDLLPNFDYLIKNGVNQPPSSLSFQNTLLPNLENLNAIENITKTITGRNFNTVEQITLTEPNWIDRLLGNWPDGKPTNKQFTLQGDSTILSKSSYFANPLIEDFAYDLNHGGIISNQAPLAKIMEILDLELKPNTYNSLSDEENFLVFLVHSPVKISSPDISPDSYVTDNLIIIPNPQKKSYTLKILGLEEGFYKLSIGQIYGNDTYWNDYFGQTFINKKETFSFNIDPSSPSAFPLVDTNGINTKNFAKAIIEEIKEEINYLDLDKDRKNLLLVPLALIKVDKPESSLASASVFRKTIATYEKEKLISSEKSFLFRNKATLLSSYLEYLTFLAPKITKSKIADNSIKLAQKTKNSIKINKLTRNSVFVYQEAEDKLNESVKNFSINDFFRAKVLANEATSLFTEAKILSY